MKIKMFTLPNLVTLMNLLFGGLAIWYAKEGYLSLAFAAIVAAAVCDFADGLLARLLNQYSPLGKQLDSLADVVSFGVAPSMVILSMTESSLQGLACGPALCWLPFLLAAFSALRLARFNIDETQHDEFRGLPVPACGLMVAAAGWISVSGTPLGLWTVLGGMVVLCWLLISPIRMFSFKFSTWGLRGNGLRYAFLAASLVMLALLRLPVAVFCIIAAYIVVSTARHLACLKCGK